MLAHHAATGLGVDARTTVHMTSGSKSSDETARTSAALRPCLPVRLRASVWRDGGARSVNAVSTVSSLLPSAAAHTVFSTRSRHSTFASGLSNLQAHAAPQPGVTSMLATGGIAIIPRRVRVKRRQQLHDWRQITAQIVGHADFALGVRR